MWIDNESPGCIYDTVDCCGCGGCLDNENDKTPLDIWLEEKERGENET